MRIIALILFAAVLAIGIGAVAADDKNDAVAHDSWGEFFPGTQHDMFAQVDGDAEHPRFEKGKQGQRRRQRKHIEQLRMLKMLELLDLDNEQEIGFLTGYNNLRKNIRRVDEARMKLLTELGEKLHNEADTDAGIENLLEQLDTNRAEKQKVEAEFLKSASTILSVRQLGKLVMFNEHFERELLDRVRVFREGKTVREHPEGP